VEGSDRDLIRYYPGICLEEVRKTTKKTGRIAGQGHWFEPVTSRTEGVLAVDHDNRFLFHVVFVRLLIRGGGLRQCSILS
jgi:hypothetical protein